MKDKIIHKATEMFLNLGFKSVTMDDIAGELGMSKKTIYVNFCNKTKLIKAVSDHLYNTIGHGISEIRAQNLDPIEELIVVKDFVNQNLNDEKSSPIFQLHKYYPKLFKEMMKKQREMVEDIIVSNIKSGIQTGVYRKEINKEFVWRIYFAGVTIIKNDDLFPPSTFSKKDVNTMFLEYHLRALVTDQGLKKLNELLNNK